MSIILYVKNIRLSLSYYAQVSNLNFNKMKSRILITLFLAIMTTTGFSASGTDDIVLDKPNLNRGKSIMQTLSQRQSGREFSATQISHTDLSDLLWAANGVNREDGKRTAPSAMNLQEITVYAFIESGAYKYDFENHVLELIKKGDYRTLVEGKQHYEVTAPLMLLYVGDTSKLSKFGESSLVVAALDAGIVCQNVNLFCSSEGLVNVPRISMDSEGLKTLLGLSSSDVPLINNAIGYKQ